MRNFLTILNRYYQNKYKRIVGYFLIILFSSSCSFFGNAVSPKQSKIIINFSNASWSKIDPDYADIAYQDKNKKRVMYLHSICGKFIAPSLEELVTELYSSMKDVHILSKNESTFLNTDSLDAEVVSTQEGKKVFFKSTSFYLDGCSVDLVLMTLDKITESDRAEFNNFKKSVSLSE